MMQKPWKMTETLAYSFGIRPIVLSGSFVMHTNKIQNPRKVTETLAYWYSSDSTQYACNEYQQERYQTVFKNVCVPMLWTNVTSALEELKVFCPYSLVVKEGISFHL